MKWTLTPTKMIQQVMATQLYYTGQRTLAECYFYLTQKLTQRW